MNNWKSPIHPGEILADELEEINLDVSQLAKRVNILCTAATCIFYSRTIV